MRFSDLSPTDVFVFIPSARVRPTGVLRDVGLGPYMRTRATEDEFTGIVHCSTGQIWNGCDQYNDSSVRVLFNMEKLIEEQKT